MGRGGEERGKMMTDSYPDPSAGMSEASTPPCTNEECASLRQSAAILSRMFAEMSSQAETCQQTKLVRTESPSFLALYSLCSLRYRSPHVSYVIVRFFIFLLCCPTAPISLLFGVYIHHSLGFSSHMH